jgi:hypothetical protein
MPQGLQSAGFSINEVIFVALSPIPLLPPELRLTNHDRSNYNSSKPLLLSFNLVDRAPYIKFYIDNIFSSKESPQEMYNFLKDHLLSRIE